jgi:NTP pyrophosphatase (non-canonical NTP hydrolase)
MSTQPSESSVDDLTALVRSFAESRDWQQFHTARNLVLALVGEAGELAAEFQWIGDDNIVNALQDADKREAVGSELADVFIYLLRLADVIGIDLAKELEKKIAVNEKRYPIDKAKGSAAKYTAYE